MGGKQYGAVLPNDLAEPVETYIKEREADGENTSQADAVRHFIRKGKEYKQQETDDTRIDPKEFALDTARIILAGAIIIAVGGLSTGTFAANDVALAAGTLALIGSSVVFVASRSRLSPLALAKTNSKPRGVRREH